MQEVSDRLHRLEDRLQRLLASGWRNVSGEAAEQDQEAAELAEAGLPELAARLAQVAAAASEMEALAAVAMALAACRLLRARLSVDELPPGPWAPLETKHLRKLAPDRVVPICRVPLGMAEVWACVRFAGGRGEELVLVRPPAGAGAAPWLREALTGGLRWQERHLLGAAGECQVCTVADHSWSAVERDTMQLAPGAPRKDQPVFSGGGHLKLVELASDDLNLYAWLNPAMAEAARSSLQRTKWALAWVDGALVAPLALMAPSGFLRPARLIHLGPNMDDEPLVMPT